MRIRVRSSLYTTQIMLAAFIAGGCTFTEAEPPASAGATAQPTMVPMTGMGTTADFAPLVTGFHEGGEVLFIHTEASDDSVAEMLTTMMGPQVVVVPELAQAPASLLANVYVFANGVSGDGPFGFQPDLFDSVPGEPSYSPLREIHRVEWSATATPEVLRSIDELEMAETRRDLTVTATGIVVNMPILAWPEAHR